ncbi:MAG: hypothetical protein ACXVIG_01345 [Halobacteriota archaeon]
MSHNPPPIQWERTYGGSKVELGRSVKQTVDGGYVVTGWTTSSGAGMCDVYFLKTDADGNKVWEQTYGRADSDGQVTV